MTTSFNGDKDNLQFRCKACDKKEKIEIDLSNTADKERLWNWLQTHSARGGDYINVPIPSEIPVKKRTEEQHYALIKKHGSVRDYLLSMGKFKDVEITIG